jgi:alpha-L-rhamnosidase
VVLAFGLLSVVPAVAPADAAARAPRLAVTSLQVDDTTTPLGIDDTHPSLSWRLGSLTADERQGTYRILVATTPDRLVPGRADVWDSGTVTSAQSVGVAYGGPALRSTQRYYWTVQVGDANRQLSGWAAPSWWEMGLLTAGDWHGAQWISPNTTDQASWSNVTIDVDFTIVRGAASLVFRAKDQSNLYLWQVNSEVTPGRVLLRPHVETNGSFNHLVPDIDISDLVTQQNVNLPHHLRVTADGTTISTWIDGTLVNTLTDATFSTGTVGFRVGDSTEDSRYDNLAVTGVDGSPLFSDDFSTDPDPSFPQTTITDGQLEPGNGIVLLDRDPAAPMLRHDFTVSKPIARARAYVDGLGLYELHVNGHKVGDRVLSPADTPYQQRSLYATYDITGSLVRGANAVGMWLGTGYGAQFSPYGFRWLGPKQAIVLIDVTYTDGTEQTVTSGGDWTWTNGPVIADDMYAGETYDARQARPGWDEPGFAGQNAVTTVPAPSASLTADDLPPMRVVRSLRPVKLTQPQPGVYVYDLGQNIAGWEQLRVTGAAGTTVRMRTAEELGTDGMLDTTTNRSAASTDRFTLAGTGGVETYEPRFTYHGFRYVEVTGYPGTPTLDSLSGQVVHADVASTGTFSSSDPLLNQIYQNNRATMLNNSMSLPTDNPVRDERTPPGMDVQAYHDASTRDFDMDRFYASYLLDMPPGTALPNDAGNSQNPDMGGDQVSLAWTLYQQYGDRTALATAYPAMKTFVDTNATNVPSHIWPADHGFGDWCPPVYGPGVDDGRGSPNIGDCTSEVSLVNTALSYRQAADLALAASALGHSADATHYTALASDIRNAFNTTFLNAAHNGYADGRQTTSILPLAFGMVPDSDLKAVGDQLVNTILTTDTGHLDTGIFGTRFLMDALARIGRVDVAMTVLDQKTYPGFGYEISQGATSNWEQWTYASNMESHDHAMFSGINASLYTVLGGITPASAGYATIDIAPQVPAGLTHACASLDTVRGTVRSCWTHSAHSFDLTITVPANASATVTVPRFGRAGIHADRGATPVRAQNGAAVYSVGSGTWHFSTDQR